MPFRNGEPISLARMLEEGPPIRPLTDEERKRQDEVMAEWQEEVERIVARAEARAAGTITTYRRTAEQRERNRKKNFLRRMTERLNAAVIDTASSLADYYNGIAPVEWPGRYNHGRSYADYVMQRLPDILRAANMGCELSSSWLHENETALDQLATLSSEPEPDITAYFHRRREFLMGRR